MYSICPIRVCEKKLLRYIARIQVTIVSASNIYVQLYTHLTIIYTLLQLCHTLIAPHIYF